MQKTDRKQFDVPSASTQALVLLVAQLANWRWSWRGMVVLGIAAPSLGVVILSHLIENRSQDFLAALFIGNLMLAVTFENQSKMASQFVYMRLTHTLTFFAGLPIRQGILIAATALSFFILSLPAMLITSLLGAQLLEVPLHPSPLLLVIGPIAAMAFAGIGAIVGTVTRSFEEAGSLSLLVNLLLLSAGPVVLPADRLPPLIVEIGHLNPATYAASALKQGLIGPITGRLALDLMILAGFLIAGLAAASRLISIKLKQ